MTLDHLLLPQRKIDRIIYFIPARGNSKSIKNKNLLMYRGKTLVQHAIDHATEASKLSGWAEKSMVCVSSENHDILEHASKYNSRVNTVSRSPELSMDDMQVDELSVITIRSFLLDGLISNANKTGFVVLQPTSVRRTADDVFDALSLWLSNPWSSVMTGYMDDRFFYHYDLEDGDRYLKPINHNPAIRLGRQWVMPNVFVENGAVYIARVDNILKHRTFRHDPMLPSLMEKYSSLELDEPKDLEELQYGK